MTNSPQDGARDFDFLHGKWRVRHRRLRERLAGCTDWEVADAIDVVRVAFNGLGNVGRFIRYVDGHPYEGMAIRLFDPGEQVWRIYWIDSTDQRMEPPVTGGFQNGVGEFVGDDVLRGHRIQVRFRWSEITPESARWEQAYSDDGGEHWEVNSIMEFRRDDSLPEEPSTSLLPEGQNS